ncbi:polyprenol phosphomannose-dependent alpha 1,6 mannosyltransferase MptB [Streptomyces avermitilis]|uniref:polyprenol phosphomannose-dependent alpha 1,6 mannosyltransferase MptB n=1 Tax=Streptomyces avermitilis TaxID=33903 RepID=UPI0033D5E32B
MAFPVDLRRCQALGLAGTAFLAAGGETAGALPARELIAPGSGRAALGLVGVYFGVVLLIAAWALLGRVVRGPEPPTVRSLMGVLAAWAAPLLLAPPLFSRDVYSYLAQGAMVDAHIDVYAYGPAQLGGPLADEVAPVWQHTPTPYGPVFLAVVSALSGLTRGELPAGLLGMRLLALLGVALMAAALPRLARHSGVDPAAALWLGALNPLVLLHLVAGAHNDAVMLGLLGVGLVAARGRWHVLGVVLVTLAALVKAPAVLGLVAVVALRRHVGVARAVATTTAGALATTALATAAAGTGYGWIAALKTPVSPHRALRAGDWEAAFALTGLAACLVSPITWVHHLVWLLPSFAVLCRRRLLRLAGALYVVLCSSVVWLWFDDASGVDGFLGSNTYVWVTLGLLLRLPAGQRRPDRPPLNRSASTTAPAPTAPAPAIAPVTGQPGPPPSCAMTASGVAGPACATVRAESSDPTGSTRPAAPNPQSSSERASSYTAKPPPD